MILWRVVGFMLLLSLLVLSTLGCAGAPGDGQPDPYADQRRMHEMEWNLEPWR